MVASSGTIMRRVVLFDGMAEPEPLADAQIQSALAALNGWEVRDGRLRRRFTFRTFLRAVAFVNSVAYLSEGAGHHPDITINYNKVTIRLITHAVDALTERDFALAREIDGKLASKLMIEAE
jgi:4a-hydroxytetrahydrobiopterin dehydratase